MAILVSHYSIANLLSSTGKKLNIYRTHVLFLWICANPIFFYIHKKWNSILTSLHWAHKKNKNYLGDSIDLLMLHCVFIKNGEIYVITAPSFVVWKHFFFFVSQHIQRMEALLLSRLQDHRSPLVKPFLQ